RRPGGQRPGRVPLLHAGRDAGRRRSAMEPQRRGARHRRRLQPRRQRPRHDAPPGARLRGDPRQLRRLGAAGERGRGGQPGASPRRSFPMTVLQEPAVTAETARSIGLNEEEFERLRKILGRDPNWTELGVTSALWSEHCSYKSSKVYLREFPTEGAHVLQGPGENAGVVDVGHGWVAVFKMESHNHPSFIEPYQGSMTGVGG